MLSLDNAARALARDEDLAPEPNLFSALCFVESKKAGKLEYIEHRGETAFFEKLKGATETIFFVLNTTYNKYMKKSEGTQKSWLFQKTLTEKWFISDFSVYFPPPFFLEFQKRLKYKSYTLISTASYYLTERSSWPTIPLIHYNEKNPIMGYYSLKFPWGPSKSEKLISNTFWPTKMFTFPWGLQKYPF